MESMQNSGVFLSPNVPQQMPYANLSQPQVSIPVQMAAPQIPMQVASQPMVQPNVMAGPIPVPVYNIPTGSMYSYSQSAYYNIPQSNIYDQPCTCPQMTCPMGPQIMPQPVPIQIAVPQAPMMQQPMPQPVMVMPMPIPMSPIYTQVPFNVSTPQQPIPTMEPQTPSPIQEPKQDSVPKEEPQVKEELKQPEPPKMDATPGQDVAPKTEPQQDAAPKAEPQMQQAPQIDVQALNAGLKSQNPQEQFNAINQIAQMAKDGGEQSKALLNEEVFRSLVDIIAKDNSKMQPAERQNADKTAIVAMWTLGMLQNNFRSAIDPELGKQGNPSLPISEVPGIVPIVQALRNPANSPEVRASAITALMLAAKPEDIAPAKAGEVPVLITILSVAAQNDPDQRVRTVAQKTLEEDIIPVLMQKSAEMMQQLQGGQQAQAQPGQPAVPQMQQVQAAPQAPQMPQMPQAPQIPGAAMNQQAPQMAQA